MNAGFGFTGYDEHGEAQWHMLDNANIWKIEVRCLSNIPIRHIRSHDINNDML